MPIADGMVITTDVITCQPENRDWKSSLIIQFGDAFRLL